MFVILGATGHVGSATATALLDAGKPVTIVTREEEKGASLRERGAVVAVADVHDVDALRAIFRQGKRAFLLNPPAHPATDTDMVERETVRCILAALDGSGLEKVVAESTYGAQPGERCGDLNVLFELEQGLKSQPIPAAIQRAAYYFSNWDDQLQSVREEGVLRTMLPAGLKIPMVSPDDLGRSAAELLTEAGGRAVPINVEGPERYSAADVAASFARALGRPVEVEVTPRDKWEDTFGSLGFSAAAARSYARMTATLVDDPHFPEEARRGQVSLDAYVAALAGPTG